MNPTEIIAKAMRDAECADRPVSWAEAAQIAIEDLTSAGYVIGQKADVTAVVGDALLALMIPADDWDGTTHAEALIKGLASAGFRIVRVAT